MTKSATVRTDPTGTVAQTAAVHQQLMTVQASKKSATHARTGQQVQQAPVDQQEKAERHLQIEGRAPGAQAEGLGIGMVLGMVLGVVAGEGLSGTGMVGTAERGRDLGVCQLTGIGSLGHQAGQLVGGEGML